MRQLVAFVGFRSAGKNTAAQPLVDIHHYQSLSFADAMKDALASIFCWQRDLLEGITDESREWREQGDIWWANRLGIAEFTPRWALKHFGTEIMREHFNQEIWVLHVERRIMLLGDTPVVLTDTRFPNEIEMIRRFNGAVVRIQRGPDPEWMEIARLANQGSEPHQHAMERHGVHASERAWVGSELDVTLQNDGSIADLQTAVLTWLKQD
jgi:hypothetical protein